MSEQKCPKCGLNNIGGIYEWGELERYCCMGCKHEFPIKSLMPRINPHATALKQDEQLIEQLKWLKVEGFKNAREAQEAGY